MLFVTKSLHARSGGLLCGGHVLDGCLTSRVEKCEEWPGV